MSVDGRDLLNSLLSQTRLDSVDLWRLLMKSCGFSFTFEDDLYEDLDVRVVPEEYRKEVYNVKTGETVAEDGDLYEALMKVAVNIIPNMEGREKWQTKPEEYERLEKELEKNHPLKYAIDASNHIEEIQKEVKIIEPEYSEEYIQARKEADENIRIDKRRQAEALIKAKNCIATTNKC